LRGPPRGPALGTFGGKRQDQGTRSRRAPRPGPQRPPSDHRTTRRDDPPHGQAARHQQRTRTHGSERSTGLRQNRGTTLRRPGDRVAVPSPGVPHSVRGFALRAGWGPPPVGGTVSTTPPSVKGSLRRFAPLTLSSVAEPRQPSGSRPDVWALFPVVAGFSVPRSGSIYEARRAARRASFAALRAWQSGQMCIVCQTTRPDSQQRWQVTIDGRHGRRRLIRRRPCASSPGPGPRWGPRSGPSGASGTPCPP
jgi:hypothetical protein